ncbi:avt5 [Symbiodinium microadriaticum]|nr:avt5 [Symbiodinium microadriaticum]
MGPEQEEVQFPVIRDLRDSGCLILLESSLQGKASSSFQRVMTRQIRFVHKAIRAARARRCDFLLHLDDDELLFPEDGDDDAGGGAVVAAAVIVAAVQANDDLRGTSVFM